MPNPMVGLSFVRLTPKLRSGIMVDFFAGHLSGGRAVQALVAHGHVASRYRRRPQTSTTTSFPFGVQIRAASTVLAFLRISMMASGIGKTAGTRRLDMPLASIATPHTEPDGMHDC
ncbi:hypothetical protein CH063_04965 [Colletotrichum higginsianum]|uniref:Uncharacterized protein n=1 Tax=Colletotrichum higginsianum (strain IMI 349063) TaxID=759273 RepID=H1UXC1_COLHI|nr:hypothetical protein CH063_04965 [Colletotrichum higginsianum]